MMWQPVMGDTLFHKSSTTALSRQALSYFSSCTGGSMRRFHFNRAEDTSGVSGVGRVADGVLFDNGLIALAWNSMHKMVGIYTSFAEMMAVHGHDGDTELVWIDPDPKAPPEPEPEPKKKRPSKKNS